MPFQIIRNDITKVKADAIVNTANPRPVIGSGTDSAVYEAAGRELLLAERRKLGGIEPGRAVSTPAFGLDAKYIIHTVGPVWVDGCHGERETLRSCYAESLVLAAGLGCRSAAFPMIATGVYGFPKDEGLTIALNEIGRFLLTHEMKVFLVVFDRKALALSERLVGDIEEYIDEHTMQRLHEAEYGGAPPNIRRRMAEERHHTEEGQQRTEGRLPAEMIIPPQDAALFLGEEGKSLDEVLGGREDSFQQRLFRLIDASGMDDVAVYKKANISRKVFSRIRCKPDYRPRKKTAVALAVALELDMPALLDLLARAEIAFSPGSTFDLIVSYYIAHRNYNVFEINAALFKYGQPLLGD